MYTCNGYCICFWNEECVLPKIFLLLLRKIYLIESSHIFVAGRPRSSASEMQGQQRTAVNEDFRAEPTHSQHSIPSKSTKVTSNFRTQSPSNARNSTSVKGQSAAAAGSLRSETSQPVSGSQRNVYKSRLASFDWFVTKLQENFLPSEELFKKKDLRNFFISVLLGKFQYDTENLEEVWCCVWALE